MDGLSLREAHTTEAAGPRDNTVQGRLRFAPDTGFQREQRRRVETFFQERGNRERDCPRVYLKTAVVLTVFLFSYCMLVLFAQTWWEAPALSVLLGFATAEVGFNIQHDSSHKAYSNRSRVNKLALMRRKIVLIRALDNHGFGQWIPVTRFNFVEVENKPGCFYGTIQVIRS